MGNFDLPVIALFASLGSLAGFLAGLLGIGGGIILVPLFLWTFSLAGFAPEILVHTAFGTSLGIIILTAISSTFGHRKHGNIDWRHVLYLALGGIAGAMAGAGLATQISGNWLKVLFGMMQILVAGNLLFVQSRLPPAKEAPPPGLSLVAVGVAGGMFSAFFGVGGGVVAVPLMVMVLRFPMHLAVGNSSALIVISSVAGTISYLVLGWGEPHLPPYSLGYVNFLVILLVAPFTVAMARLGVKVAARMSHDRLVKVFAIILILVGVRMIVRY